MDKQEKISIDTRIENLKKLKMAIKKHETNILKALELDLGKCEFESYETEVGLMYSSINHMIKNIKKWSKPKKYSNDMAQLFSKSMVYKAFHGIVLIIGPYNYPFQLLIEPLIGSIAGGNCTVLKPSEYTPNVEKAIKKLIEETFSEDYIKVITGDYQVNSSLLDLDFDYIFFTGSVGVGKIIMEKASKRLIPITLELGGKSPVIVDESAKIDVSTERIVWGKFTNAGQTCVAPDYVLVHENIYDEFCNSMVNTINKFYGQDIKSNKEFGRIVNHKHILRLKNILDKDKDKIFFGGDIDMESKYISPTIIKDANLNCESMQDEIFGPILPIIKYKEISDIKTYINAHKKPLALYVFSENKKFANDIIDRFAFGGGCVNDTISHVASKYLPFGGVGTSGVGRYHGKSSFDLFTYEKAIVKKSTKINIKMAFPPYNKRLKILRFLMK